MPVIIYNFSFSTIQKKTFKVFGTLKVFCAMRLIMHQPKEWKICNSNLNPAFKPEITKVKKFSFETTPGSDLSYIAQVQPR